MNTMTHDPDDFEKRLAAIEKKLGISNSGTPGTIGAGGILVNDGGSLSITGSSMTAGTLGNKAGTITTGYTSTYVDKAPTRPGSERSQRLWRKALRAAHRSYRSNISGGWYTLADRDLERIRQIEGYIKAVS